MKHFLSLFCFCVALMSCNQHSTNNKEKAQALADKEKELKIKEEALIEREKYQLEQEKLALQEEKKKIAKEKKQVEAQQQATVTQTHQQVIAPPSSPTIAPDAFVRGFLQDLGRRDFKSAFYRCNMSHIKSFRTYEAFSSTNAYGGVSKVEIRKVKTLQANANAAMVYAQYYAADPYNKDGVYFQNFYLRNENGYWKIVKIQTTEMAQF